MCKLYIETSDLDNAVLAYIDGNASAEGVAIQGLESEQLKDFTAGASSAASFFSIEDHTYHAITAGIAIGLKLAESGFELDVAAYSDGIAEVVQVEEDEQQFSEGYKAGYDDGYVDGLTDNEDELEYAADDAVAA